MHLSEEQVKVIETRNTPIILSGKAGSGKTLSIMLRCDSLLSDGLQPIVLTFSSRTVRHMKDVVKSNPTLFKNPESSASTIYTFHAYGLKLLKENVRDTELNHDFSVAPPATTLSIIKMIVEKIGGEANEKEIAEKILKKEPVNPKIYELYKKTLKKNNLVDFPDLLSLPTKYLSQGVFTKPDDIIVDEAQDIDRPQANLVVSAINENESICISGDSSQGIYTWRGGGAHNIEEIVRHLQKKPIEINLQKNFRSEKEIESVSEGALNSDLAEKILSSNHVKVEALKNPIEEASRICDYIAAVRKRDIPYGSIAVLSRFKKGLIPVEKEMIKRGIPYKKGDGEPLAKKQISKEYISLLMYIVQPNDLSLSTWLTGFQGFLTYRELIKIRKLGRSAESALEDPSELPISPKKKARLKKLGKAIVEIRGVTERGGTTEEILLKVEEKLQILSDLKKRWLGGSKREKEKFKSAVSDIEAVNSIVIESGEIKSALSSLLVEDVDSSGGEEEVMLTTIHGAKGLEFEVVFVTGLSDGTLPSWKAKKNPDVMKEEKNLFYVAVTRAKRMLVLTYGKFTDMGVARPSPFISGVIKKRRG